jgi:hypothetical protein
MNRRVFAALRVTLDRGDIVHVHVRIGKVR